jgi:hypothetical protein
VILAVRGIVVTVGGSAQAAQSATPSAATHTVPPLPAGYRLAQEPLGFDIPVPTGWTREAQGARYEVDYVSPGKSAVLRVNVLDYAGPSPLQTFKELEPREKSTVSRYRQLRMSATRWNGQSAAIWEYLFHGKDGVSHVKDLGIGKEGGTGYTVYLSAPEAKWAAYRQVFDKAVAGLIVHKQ